MFDIKKENTLQRGLTDGKDPAVPDMFAKKHAKAGSGHRTWFVVVCQINKRQRSAGRNTEFFLPSRRLYGKEEFIIFRLRDFSDPASC